MFTRKLALIAGAAALAVTLFSATASGGEITEKSLYGPIVHNDSGSEVVRDIPSTAQPSRDISDAQAKEFAQPQLHHESSDVWDIPRFE